MDCQKDNESTILFEIFKRFENYKHFPDRKIDSGTKELKRIVHEVCSEISYLNHDDATEEFFFNAILNIYDDIALHHYNQKAEDFSNKYMDYIHNQISEIRYEF